MRIFAEERGQALVIVAAAAVALLAALALALDWGFGLTQRRVAQNAADASALRGAKLLASSVKIDGSFSATQEAVWCAADAFAGQNNPFAGANTVRTTTVSFSADGSVWTPALSSATCPAGRVGTTIPSTTAFVRARVALSYPGLAGSVTGSGTITAAASARARLTGSEAPRGPVWPMVRHYDASEFVQPCGPECDPSTVTPIQFWNSSAGATQQYGSFRSFLDLSRYSSRHATLSSPETVSQLLTTWDGSGSLSATPPTAPRPDLSGNCGRPWDTQGGEDPSRRNEWCSLPNFPEYSFYGQMALDKKWAGALLPGQELPGAIGTRQTCSSAPWWLTAPSCSDATLGDWIETTFRGRPTSILWTYIRGYVDAHGVRTAYSDTLIPGGGGATYGRAVQVLVYFWDCGQSFDPSATPGNRWRIIPGTSGDCSRLPSGSGATTADRVHLFTVVPFTFYQGLVNSSQVSGYWGGAVDDPGSCQRAPAGCPVNPISNSVFLVADD